LNRLPSNDVLWPYTIELIDLATKVLVTDNEENALTAVRILFDLHKKLRNIKCVQCHTNRADAVLRRNGSCTLCWSCAEAEFSKSLATI